MSYELAALIITTMPLDYIAFPESKFKALTYKSKMNTSFSFLYCCLYFTFKQGKYAYSLLTTGYSLLVFLLCYSSLQLSKLYCR